MPPLKTLLLLLETSSVVDKKCQSLQLYYKRAPLYYELYFSSYALILGVSRKKSYCTEEVSKKRSSIFKGGMTNQRK